MTDHSGLTMPARIQDALLTAGEPLTMPEIAKRIGVSADYLHTRTIRWVTAGYLVRPARGRYAVGPVPAELHQGAKIALCPMQSYVLAQCAHEPRTLETLTELCDQHPDWVEGYVTRLVKAAYVERTGDVVTITAKGMQRAWFDGVRP